MNNLNVFSFDLILKIISRIPNAKDLKTINKHYNDIIKKVFDYYNEKFQFIVNDWKNHLAELIKVLINSNDVQSIVFLFNNYKKSRKLINFYAAYYDNKILFNDLNLDDDIEIAKGAAAGGKLNLLKEQLNKGVTNYQDLANYAALNGNTGIVHYMMQKYNLKNYKDIAINAAMGNDLPLVEYAFNNGAGNYKEILQIAAINGYNNIAEYIIEKYPSEKQELLEEIAKLAAFNGHLYLIIYVTNQGYRDANKIAYEAAKSGKLNIIQYLENIGEEKLDYKEIALCATKAGYLYVVNYAISMGADNFTEILNIARKYNQNNIINYLSEKYNTK